MIRCRGTRSPDKRDWYISSASPEIGASSLRQVRSKLLDHLIKWTLTRPVFFYLVGLHFWLGRVEKFSEATNTTLII